MKTPDEIKRGLECDNCKTCSYSERNNNDGDNHCGEVEADALAYIQQLEQERIMLMDTVSKMCGKTPRWISVEERLPSITGKYIVCTAKGSVYCTKFSVHKVGGDFHTPDSYTRITHWMPLPSAEGLNDN